MNRRNFLWNAAGVAGYLASSRIAKARSATIAPHPSGISRNLSSISTHRFGVNYTPSRNWWFCWNDWETDSIQRDLDAIAALSADHMRILLIWPFFQPNAAWVSTAHLDRLHQLLSMMATRRLDAVVTVFTGQLSGLFFLPPFHRAADEFYSDPKMWQAQELFVRKLAQVTNTHENVIGFDLGNELNTCWQADVSSGDAWMRKMLALMQTVAPASLNVNGVDNQPWFERNTFSPDALAAQPFPAIHCYPWWTGALKYGGPMDPPSTHLVAAMATLARSYMEDQNRPIWAEEFNTCFDFFTEKQQAKWLQTTVLSAMDVGVSWFTYWDSHDVNHKFAFNNVEYSLGLLTNDGKVKEQGRQFKELAQAYGGKPVVVLAQAPPRPPENRSADVTWRWMLDWMGWKPRS